jgi:transcriptional regulator with GAF, ATPase, and Fis domain
MCRPEDDRAPDPRAARRLALLVIDSPDEKQRGTVFPLADRARIGRSGTADVDLAFGDSKMSRRHATVAWRADACAYEVEDHDSTNGTYLNRLRVRRERLVAGSILRVGDTFLELGEMPSGPADVVGEGALVGRSAVFRRALAAADDAARSDLPVLILGETGTGKELFARRIHESRRTAGPLVALNCSALPPELVEAQLFGHKKGAFTGAVVDAKGFFAKAERGTLLLDEVGDLPAAIQPKLLRVLEEAEYIPVGATEPVRAHVRVIAATNVDLKAAVAAERFRLDLYARLAGYELRLPPLRKRRSDIPILLHHFLAAAAPGRRLAWTANFLEALLLHDWPGNVRELKTLARRLALVEEATLPLAVTHLPEEIVPSLPPPAGAVPPAGAPSRGELEALLSECRGNVAEVAARRNKDRKQVYRWLKKYSVDPERFRPPEEGPG